MGAQSLRRQPAHEEEDAEPLGRDARPAHLGGVVAGIRIGRGERALVAVVDVHAVLGKALAPPPGGVDHGAHLRDGVDRGVESLCTHQVDGSERKVVGDGVDSSLGTGVIHITRRAARNTDTANE